jgi:hypothetical protein
MSITASTCITFTGYEPIGNTLNLYSNIDNFVSSFGTVLTTQITGSSCPYIMSGIPDGTTSVQLRDPISLCCTTIFLQNNNLCVNCNLSLTSYLTNTVSQLVVGLLVGDCDDNISDYIINWYRTGSSEVVLTTGYGTEFADIGWDLTHPLTGNSSPIVEPGTYYPVIERVIINDIIYSNSGGTGIYPANLNCFDNQKVSVTAIECGQGNNLGDYLNHYIFNNYSVGVEPLALSANFELSNTTNYVAWMFRGFQVNDALKMVFYGSAYGNEPIMIENVKIGLDAGTPNVGPNVNPKIIDKDQFIKKVTCLTGFTINNGDYIKITVIPNNTNNNTLWDFYFTCLDTFDCTTCADQFQNSYPKIDLSTLSVIPYECDKVDITAEVSGCTFADLVTTDVGKYFSYALPNTILREAFVGGYGLYFSANNCNIFTCYNINQLICGPSGSTYTFTKTIVNNQGLINFVFTGITDLQYYYSGYLSMMSCLSGGSSTDNTNLGFYRCFDLYITNPQNPDEPCGDTTPYIYYTLHHTAVVTTGGTGPFTMSITMPTITNGYTSVGCGDCSQSSLDGWVVNRCNNSSLSTSNNTSMLTNTGSKWVAPFRNGYVAVILSNTQNIVVRPSYLTRWQFENETYAYSGVNNTIIPSLSGKTCEYRGERIDNFQSSGGFGYQQNIGQWNTRLTNQNNIEDFEVIVYPKSNWVYTNGEITALTYSNGSITYSNPDYTF